MGELETRYEAVVKRMDKLYDDKLDEKITQEFYNRKFKQYSKEKDELTETIKRHSTASAGYWVGWTPYIEEISAKPKS